MKVSGHKEFRAVGVKGAGRPNDSQLAAINGYALAPQTADSVYVRSFYLAHNAIDRDGEFFDDGLLADFASTLPGKGLFIKHPMSWDGDSGPGEGRWFAAKVVSMSQDEARKALNQPNLQWAPSVTEAKLLVADAYMARTPENEALITKIDAGVAGDCSIGFGCAGRVGEKDEYGNEVADRLMPPGEALEGSLVWLGAQPGARAFKGADRRRPEQTETEETDMDLQKLLDEAKARIKELEIHVVPAGSFKAIADAIGGELAGNPARLKLLVQEGELLRKELVEDIVRMERLVGVGDIKDTPEAVAAAKAVHQDTPVERLKAYAKRLSAMSGGKGGNIEGGDPRGTEAGPQIDPVTGKNKGAGQEVSAEGKGVLDNPLLGGKQAQKAA